jgi:uncharacterized protein YjbI with pentapeptide repeats
MPEEIVEAAFVCACGQWASYACRGEAFYKEHEGKRYCVLHYPGKEKAADFKEILMRKLDDKDFVFRGVWFPDNISFDNVEFSERVDFSSATFSADVSFNRATFVGAAFSDAKFESSASFNAATFGAVAYFSGAIFGAKADFCFANFIKGADFISTTFSGEAIFSGAAFAGEVDPGAAEAGFKVSANFKSSAFKAKADFISARFDGADFSFTTFTEGAHFSGAIFSAKEKVSGVAYFTSATFGARANFNDAMFSGEAYFTSANFGKGVDFIVATFTLVAYFDEAIFSAKADFSSAKFAERVSFRSATFRNYVTFAGNENRPVFSDGASLSLQFASVEKPDLVSFHSLTLRPHWFVNVDPRKFDFINIDWTWPRIDEEIERIKNYKISHQHRMLAIVCRALAVNAEENHRYEEASRFRYMAMDTRRLEGWRGFAFWRLNWWYWLASGYSERVFQAFLVLLGIWLLSSVLYTQVGFTASGPMTTSESDMPAVKRDEVGVPLFWSRALTYSAGVMTLQKPEPRPATIAAQSLVILETVLGPFQAALLALAIRRKFMR